MRVLRRRSGAVPAAHRPPAQLPARRAQATGYLVGTAGRGATAPGAGLDSRPAAEGWVLMPVWVGPPAPRGRTLPVIDAEAIEDERRGSSATSPADGSTRTWVVVTPYCSVCLQAPPTEHVTDAAGLDLADIPEAPGTGEADNAGGDDPDEFVIAATDGQQFPLVTASIQPVEPRSTVQCPASGQVAKFGLGRVRRRGRFSTSTDGVEYR